MFSLYLSLLPQLFPLNLFKVQLNRLEPRWGLAVSLDVSNRKGSWPQLTTTIFASDTGFSTWWLLVEQMTPRLTTCFLIYNMNNQTYGRALFGEERTLRNWLGSRKVSHLFPQGLIFLIYEFSQCHHGLFKNEVTIYIPAEMSVSAEQYRCFYIRPAALGFLEPRIHLRLGAPGEQGTWLCA